MHSHDLVPVPGTKCDKHVFLEGDPASLCWTLLYCGEARSPVLVFRANLVS